MNDKELDAWISWILSDQYTLPLYRPLMVSLNLVIYKALHKSGIMMTSSNENIFRDTGPLCCSPVVTTQRPVTRGFDVFFDLHLNKRLSKQSRRWWFETPSLSLWRHCNDNFFLVYSWIVKYGNAWVYISYHIITHHTQPIQHHTLTINNHFGIQSMA